MQELELERTYLAKFFPPSLKSFIREELLDVYVPKASDHPKLRLRKKGEHYEITKKSPLNIADASEQMEHTIALTKEEFDALSAVSGKVVKKDRYYFNHKNNIAEIDVFQGDLKGLVLIDFEFKTAEEKNNFVAPNFCLAEVTDEEFVAGGKLCGKKYRDIEKELEKFQYQKLLLK